MLNNEELDRLAQIANEAADVARQIIRKYYSTGVRFKFTEKNGDGPVTCVDIEAEEAMVTVITNAFPSHSIYGEETGWHNRDNSLIPNQFIWVLDPIDGTSSFVGKDSSAFGILVAVVYNGRPIIGCIDHPILKLRWMGIRGRRTTVNSEQVSTMDCHDMAKACVHLKGPNYNDDAKQGYDCISSRVAKKFFDRNCIAYGELASGFYDVVVDCALDPFDFLALIPIINGAGGVITDWQGRELLWSPLRMIPEGGFKIVAAAGKHIHQQIVRAL